MKLIFSEINLVFSIICSIFVEDKNNWTMINFSKFNSLYSVATYFNTESKYLQRYVDEAVYRWNTRKMSGSDCFKSMFAASIGVVDYEMVKQVA